MTSCRYVGSRDLWNSCDRKGQFPIPDFDGLNPKVYEDIEEDNKILHVCPQALNNFVTKVLPNLTRPFILLTNNSDWTIPDDVQEEFNSLVESPLLTHWFAQNCIIDHPKVTRIPIGLDYHTLIPTRKKTFHWTSPEIHPWGIKQPPIEQEQQLITLKMKSPPFWYRRIKAYANFQFLMTTRYGKVDRVDAYETIPKDLVFYEPAKCTRLACWKNMIKHAFVISPQGNGLDCHRTWEAICLGSVPIVKSSGLNPLFDNLPVWIVNDWSEVTKQNMVKKIDEFKYKTFQYERCSLVYYQNLFQEKQNGSRRKDS